MAREIKIAVLVTMTTKSIDRPKSLSHYSNSSNRVAAVCEPHIRIIPKLEQVRLSA